MIKKKEKIVISVGGSLIAPNGLDVNFLSGLNDFLRNKIKKNLSWQFFIVTGGGRVARDYRDAGHAVIGKELSNDDLDWLGIHATRLNAHLIRTIFRDLAHPVVIKDYEMIHKAQKPVVVAAGWKPGWSTDYCAVQICEDYGVSRIVNLSNIDRVYERDPKKYPDAKSFDEISWANFKKLIGGKWSPGMHAPFDPIASRKAAKLKLEVAVLRGGDWHNFENYLIGREFEGTRIF